MNSRMSEREESVGVGCECEHIVTLPHQSPIAFQHPSAIFKCKMNMPQKEIYFYCLATAYDHGC